MSDDPESLDGDPASWPEIITGGTGPNPFPARPNWPVVINGPTWKGPAEPKVLGLDAPGLQGWTDAFTDLWSGGSAVASGAASAGGGIVTAVNWWDKNGGKVKIGAALIGGGLLGLVVWKLVK